MKLNQMLDGPILRKHLLILVAYSVAFRAWIALAIGGYGAILPLVLMAVGVGVHVLMLFFGVVSSEDPHIRRTNLVALLLVALLGFGTCVMVL